ncbi:hypothetical protein CB0940_02814 [Cercospora beticola]|uniref:Uncharacterized protein n=1 Tax=Cercospora beticola TaxID=122368 RepID=A0A2G5I2J6_CERBT|nr:hypothetical protein CB0940_02814 [Cercospora beticola]PIA99009.1 hypothetical protein CB0940_02814 [Cercospora beticola]
MRHQPIHKSGLAGACLTGLDCSGLHSLDCQDGTRDPTKPQVQYMSTELSYESSSSLSRLERRPFLISKAAISAERRSSKVMPSG